MLAETGTGMKFWQLTSLMRGHFAALQKVALGKAEWRFAATWISELDGIIREQDRDKLDSVLDERFVRAVLRKCPVWFFLTPSHQLCSRRQSLLDKKLSALRAFDRYGGDALEEAQEYGSVRIGS